jgi:putative N6-adenine-specific DNA methylase
MASITLIATAAFGHESLVKREVMALGFKDIKVTEGKVEFSASPRDIPTPNIWLRTAGRVLLKLGEFRAVTFDELFEQTKALPWEDWITEDGKFIVNGKSVKSQLGSFSACQSIVKKAIAERLMAHYETDWLEETGANFTVQVAMLKDVATLTIDTTGSGLNKRGYRDHAGAAALRETMAAMMVKLSFWNKDRILVDPMCGSGTILIEAAMIARNIAPGLDRRFDSEKWPAIPKASWKAVRRQAREKIDFDTELKIYGYDIDPEILKSAKANAVNAGVEEDIVFEQKDVKDLWIDQEFGVVISNPPYGVKMGSFDEINQIYISLNKTFRKKAGWSVYIITADKKFPDYFKRARPSKVRKLFNGPMEVNYYQYFGGRPPRESEAGS